MSAAIVCGVDGSRDSPAALQVAARLARRLDLRLVVAHVAEPASRGRGAFKSAFLGSVSNALVGVARCPGRRT